MEEGTDVNLYGMKENFSTYKNYPFLKIENLSE